MNHITHPEFRQLGFWSTILVLIVFTLAYAQEEQPCIPEENPNACTFSFVTLIDQATIEGTFTIVVPPEIYESYIEIMGLISVAMEDLEFEECETFETDIDSYLLPITEFSINVFQDELPGDFEFGLEVFVMISDEVEEKVSECGGNLQTLFIKVGDGVYEEMESVRVITGSSEARGIKARISHHGGVLPLGIAGDGH